MTTVFDALVLKYEEEITAAKNYLIQGKAADFSEYRHMCGQIRGLLIAQRLTSDLANQYRKQEDDE